MKNFKLKKSNLLSTASVLAVLISTNSLHAQIATVDNGTDFIIEIQDNRPFDINPNLTIDSIVGATVEIDVTGLLNDSITLIGGLGADRVIVSAASTGNDASSQIDSDVTNDNIGVRRASLIARAPISGPVGDERYRATASADFANLAIALAQNIHTVTAIASQESELEINMGAIADSSAGVLNNVQESIGLLNRADNNIDMLANNANATAGIVTSQVVTTSTLSSTVTAGASIAVDEAARDSTLAVIGNTQRTVGIGSVAENEISLNANEFVGLTSGGVIGLARTNQPLTTAFVVTAEAEAPLAIASSQILFGPSSNIQTGVTEVRSNNSGDGFQISVGSDLSGESVVGAKIENKNNVSFASARGNQVDNSISIDATEVVTRNETTNALQRGDIAAIASLQSFNALLEAEIDSAGVMSLMGGDVIQSEANTSQNQIEAQAIANLGGNRIAVSANQIDTGVGIGTSAPQASSGVFFAFSRAPFGIANNQSAAGSIQASLSPSGPNILTGISGDLFDSKILSNQNTLSARATINDASGEGNSITIDSANNVRTGTAVTNRQTAQAEASASVGAENAPNAVRIDLSAGSVDDSTVAVEDNRISAQLLGNIAVNSIDISANDMDLARGIPLDPLDRPSDAARQSPAGHAISSQSLGNTQTLGPQTLSASTFGAFEVLVDVSDYVITDSTLSVSDNTQLSSSRGNIAENSIELDARNATTDAAVSSNQEGAARILASSTMSISAPSAISDSSLNMDGNRNEAVGVLNIASNQITVDIETLVSISSGANVRLLSSDPAPADLSPLVDGVIARADFIINNRQIGTSPNSEISASGETQVINIDDTIPETAGILRSSVSAHANDTEVTSAANRSSNIMDLQGGSSFAATGGIVNTQESIAPVTASGDVLIRIQLDGGSQTTGAATAESSSLSVSENTSETSATGNVSQNILNASALALEGNPLGDSAFVNLNSGAIVDGGVQASFGVLNNQRNTAGINSLLSVNYQTVLNAGPAPQALSRTAVQISDNTAESFAVGNNTTNRMILSALDYGTSTAAIGNEQSNSGNVLASLSGSTFGHQSIGSIQGSSIGVAGNIAVSNAVGNRAISSLVRN